MPDTHMTARDFRAALRFMGWTQTTARDELAVATVQRVNDWCRGRRGVPSYIAASLRAHLELFVCRAGAKEAAERTKSFQRPASWGPGREATP